jgi:hypothetical protein
VCPCATPILRPHINIQKIIKKKRKYKIQKKMKNEKVGKIKKISVRRMLKKLSKTGQEGSKYLKLTN